MQFLIYCDYPLEVVAKPIYLLNFYSGSPMCPATVWIISGCGAAVKMTQLRLRSSSFHKHGSGSTSGALGFHECVFRSGALFFRGSGFSSFSHINILIVLACLKLEWKMNQSKCTKLREHTKHF